MLTARNIALRGKLSGARLRRTTSRSERRKRAPRSEHDNLDRAARSDLCSRPLRAAARALADGYFFSSTYDKAGRPLTTERRLGTPSARATTDETRLSETFESGTTGWIEGVLDGSFTALDGLWRTATPSQLSACNVDPPPTAEASVASLWFGDPATCNYRYGGASPKAIRKDIPNAQLTDEISFLYWRQIRESASSSGKDRFSVLVSFDASLSGARHAFDADDGRLSFRKWRRSPVIRMRDLFSADEWGTGARTVYLAFVFEKGDEADSGLGTGVVVDDLFIGRRMVEVLVDRKYDVSACVALGTASPCGVGDESTDAPLGQLTKVVSYQDGWPVARQDLVYRGLNGRASGVRELLDWTGVGALPTAPTAGFSWSWLHRPWGAVSEMLYPHQSSDQAHTYELRSVRGLLSSFAELTSTGPHEFFAHPLTYDAAAALREIRFANDSKQTIARDGLYRPLTITSSGPSDGQAEGPDCDGTITNGRKDHWCSGAYSFDAAGNIAGIGAQTFLYDNLGRLRESHVRPQASDPAQQSLDILTNTYDPFGNMLTQTQTDPPTPPRLGLSFVHSVDPATNRITNRTSGSTRTFTHDAAGNATRFIGQVEEAAGAGWDAAGRLRVFFDSNPSCSGSPFECATPVEESSYDASGYRVVHIDGRGRPVISLRQGDGGVLAEYAVRNTDNAAHLERHQLYGAGQLLVERPVVVTAPQPQPRVPIWDIVGVWLDAGVTDPEVSLMADVSAPSGFRNSVSGLTPDAQGDVQLPESALSPGETNTLQFRTTSPEESAYSLPVNVVVDPSVTSGTPNQVRAVAVSHSGNDLVVRWKLLAENGQKTRVYFKPEGSSQRMLLTATALSAGVRQYVLSNQTYSLVCGEFTLDSVITGQPSQTSAPIQTPACSTSAAAPVTPTTGGFLVDRFHHRDHLGSLRVSFDERGWPTARHDFYPFGREMRPGLAESRRLFTGHERDAGSGLDYMLARYYSAGVGRFLSVDPLLDTDSENGQSWNFYAYVRNNPLNAADPTGLFLRFTDQALANAASRLASGSPTIAAILDAHDQIAEPDLTIGAGTLALTPAGETPLGHTDSEFTLASTGAVSYGSSEVTVDLAATGIGTTLMVETFVEELCHLQAALNDPAGVVGQGPPDFNVPHRDRPCRATDLGAWLEQHMVVSPTDKRRVADIYHLPGRTMHFLASPVRCFNTGSDTICTPKRRCRVPDCYKNFLSRHDGSGETWKRRIPLTEYPVYPLVHGGQVLLIENTNQEVSLIVVDLATGRLRERITLPRELGVIGNDDDVGCEPTAAGDLVALQADRRGHSDSPSDIYVVRVPSLRLVSRERRQPEGSQ